MFSKVNKDQKLGKVLKVINQNLSKLEQQIDRNTIKDIQINSIQYSEKSITGVFRIIAPQKSPYQGFWLNIQLKWSEKKGDYPPVCRFRQKIWNPFIEFNTGIVPNSQYQPQYKDNSPIHLIINWLRSQLTREVKNEKKYMNAKAAQQKCNLGSSQYQITARDLCYCGEGYEPVLFVQNKFEIQEHKRKIDLVQLQKRIKSPIKDSRRFTYKQIDHQRGCQIYADEVKGDISLFLKKGKREQNKFEQPKLDNDIYEQMNDYDLTKKKNIQSQQVQDVLNKEMENNEIKSQQQLQKKKQQIDRRQRQLEYRQINKIRQQQQDGQSHGSNYIREQQHFQSHGLKNLNIQQQVKALIKHIKPNTIENMQTKSVASSYKAPSSLISHMIQQNYPIRIIDHRQHPGIPHYNSNNHNPHQTNNYHNPNNPNTTDNINNPNTTNNRQ